MRRWVHLRKILLWRSSFSLLLCAGSMSHELVLRNAYLVAEIIRWLGSVAEWRVVLSTLCVSTHFRNPYVILEAFRAMRITRVDDALRVYELVNNRLSTVGIMAIDHDYTKNGRIVRSELRLRELLQDVHTLRLSKTTIVDVSALGGVRALDLSFARVSDVSALGSVHELNLYGTDVSDVSALGSVRELNLGRTNVFDVTSLSDVHVLNLSGTAVTDVSALRNLHTLDLSNTAVTDVSALSNLHALNLSNTAVTDVSALGRLHTLDLSDTAVRDVSALGNLHALDLSKTAVRDVRALGSIQELYLPANDALWKQLKGTRAALFHRTGANRAEK